MEDIKTVLASSVFLTNLHHAYAQTDGTYAFQNSREGDMLKQAKREIEELRAVLAASEQAAPAGAEQAYCSYPNCQDAGGCKGACYTHPATNKAAQPCSGQSCGHCEPEHGCKSSADAERVAFINWKSQRGEAANYHGDGVFSGVSQGQWEAWMEGRYRASQPLPLVPLCLTIEDAIEKAYWNMLARKNGEGQSKTIPMSERDAFKAEVRGAMSGKCRCSLTIRILGDGCRYCQPQEHINNLEKWLEEERTISTSSIGVLQKIANSGIECSSSNDYRRKVELMCKQVLESIK